MKLQVILDGHPVEVDARLLELIVEVEPGVYSVLVDGRSFEARAVPGAQGLSVLAGGRQFLAEVRDARNFSRSSRAALGGGRQNLVAPMPGKVIRVLVAKGDVVEAGQGLVVVEAMKMQNEMKASRPGQVMDVRVRDGDTVSAGQALVVLE
jgi:biotin carboxyl carrier protein